jgi:hypothetical protein
MPRALIFSDIHSDAKALERLMSIEADLYFAAGDLVNWARGLERMGEIMARRAPQIHVMPGNHESAGHIEQFCQRFGFVNFHEKALEMNGLHFAGLGYSNPTPFDTPGEYSEEEIAEKLAPFAGLKPLALICHAPPLNTALDRIREGLHPGSRAVGEFIAAHQPAYFFCGHIHEAEGVEIQMGSTIARNAGKRGFLLNF